MKPVIKKPVKFSKQMEKRKNEIKEKLEQIDRIIDCKIRSVCMLPNTGKR